MIGLGPNSPNRDASGVRYVYEGRVPTLAGDTPTQFI